MAAIVSPPASLYAGQPVAQAQDANLYSGQQTTLPIQTQSIAQTQNPLFEALKRYITTGPQAEHVTSSQLQEAYANATEGGIAGLESFLANTQPNKDHQIWEHQLRFKGQVTVSKLQFKFHIASQELGIPYAVGGSAVSCFVPWSGSVDGQLFFNSTSDFNGNCTFVARVDWAGVFTIFIRNSEGKPIASFVGSPAPFSHEHCDVKGTCSWAQ